MFAWLNPTAFSFYTVDFYLRVQSMLCKSGKKKSKTKLVLMFYCTCLCSLFTLKILHKKHNSRS